MKYFDQVREFYDLQLSNPLSTGQIALWHALMHINNKCSWKEWFTVANMTLELHTGLSRQGIVKARNVLKQLALIDFKSNGTKATSYTVKRLYMSDSLQDGVQNSIQDGVQNSIPLVIPDKTRLDHKEIPPTPRPKKETPILSEIQKTEEWAGFTEYRKKTKKPLTDRAVTLALNSLENLAPNDLVTQKKILDQSVLKGWTGLFKLKEENDAGYSRSHSKQDATGSTTNHKPRFGIVAGEDTGS